MDNNWNFDQENRNKGQKRSSVAGLMALGVVIALVLGSLYYSFQDRYRAAFTADMYLEQSQTIQNQKPVEQADTLSASQNNTDRVRGSLDVSDVVEAAMPCIVAITSESVQTVESFFYGRVQIPSEGAGSGIIIGQNDTELLIATNYHVIEDASSLSVSFSVGAEDNTVVEAKIKGSDVSKDLAVVSISIDAIPQQVLSKIRIAVLGDSDALAVGQKAIAIGNALGYGQSVTAGIVSAVDRELTVDGTTQTYIQTDAAINFGNSGGALLDDKGQVIGINSAKAASSGAERMGYAIPINEAKPILEELMNRVPREKVESGEQGSLGIRAQNVSAQAQFLYDIPSGAYVTEVQAGSAADLAGIEPGDIITEWDGVAIDSVETLAEQLGYYRSGETIEVRYVTGRSGIYQEQAGSVTLQ